MIDVVGIGADGLGGLAPKMRELIASADAVIGGNRHLDMARTVNSAEHVQYYAWPRPLRAQLGDFMARLITHHVNIVVLASGDPLRSGIATTLIEALGREAVRVHPHISSDTLARARMGWSAETTDVVTLVGRQVERLVPDLAPSARIVVLCSDGQTPASIASLLTSAGWGETLMTAWWNLGGPDEGSRATRAAEWSDTVTPDLVLVCLELPEGGPETQTLGPTPGRADDAFTHDGLITKRDIRATALARLRPLPGQVLWDVGAGSGAIGIEWTLGAPRARAVAIERNPQRLARIAENAHIFGVSDRLHIIDAETSRAVADANLASPDAVFLGGGISADVIATCIRRLLPGGRLVGHAVTLETEALLVDGWRQHGGDLTRIQVETASPLGTMTGFRPARAVVQWCFTKPTSQTNTTTVTGPEEEKSE